MVDFTMNPWPFIIAAYALTLVGAAGLSVASLRAMIAAERRADALKRDR
ncbi:hypothetical protein [Sphingobium sp. SCG-1]|nr:hypothetical protein [Sphingobium sp. SCG-1]